MRKLKLISNYMTSQTGKHIITTHYCSISEEVKIETIKFGSLLQYNMRIIFLEKSFTKYGGMLVPGPFIKNQN